MTELVRVVHGLEDVFGRAGVVRSCGGARPKDIPGIRAKLLTQRGMLDLERIRDDARPFLSDESWRELDRLLAETA